MDFDEVAMSNINDMEYASSYIFGWFEADDCCEWYDCDEDK